VKWDAGTHPGLNSNSVEKHFTEDLDKPGAVAANRGDVKKALGEASKKVEAIYFLPFVAHATMEPMNCTAHVQADRCDVWGPTQAQTLSQMTASRLSGVPPEKVYIHTTLLGCGLGRRARPDFVTDAVAASKAVGKPVKVVWSREEDIKYDSFRAATCQRIEAGLDSENRLIAWSHKVACASILKFMNPAGIKDGVDMYSLLESLTIPTPMSRVTHPTRSRTFTLNRSFPIFQSLPVPGAPCRTPPMRLSWNVSWTSWPMRPEKIPSSSAWVSSAAIGGSDGSWKQWQRRPTGGNRSLKERAGALPSTPVLGPLSPK